MAVNNSNNAQRETGSQADARTIAQKKLTLQFLSTYHAQNRAAVAGEVPTIHDSDQTDLSLAVLLNHVKRSNTPISIVENARQSLSSKHYRSFLRSLFKNRALWNRVYPCSMPRLYRQILSREFSHHISLAREITWSAAYLSLYLIQLKKYLHKKGIIQHSLLRRDFAGCIRELSALDQECGLSLWSIIKRFLILGHTEGLDGQKKFLASLRSECNQNGIAHFIAAHASISNEPTVSIIHYKRIAEENHAYLRGIDSSLEHFIMYHNFPDFRLTVESAADVLQISSCGSFIDYYEALISVVSEIPSWSLPSPEDSTIKEITKASYSAMAMIDTHREDIRWIVFKSNQEKIEPPELLLSTLSERTIECWLTGNYSESLETALIGARECIDCAEYLEYAARCLNSMNLNTAPMQNDNSRYLIDLMRNILQRTQDHESSILELAKFARNNNGESISDGLMHFAIRESSNAIIEGVVGSRLNGRTAISLKSVAAFLNSARPAVIQRSISRIRNETVRKALSFLTSQSCEPPSGLTTEAHLALSLYRALLRKDLDVALATTNQMTETTCPSFFHDSIRAQAACLWGTRQILACIEHMADVYVRNPHWVDLLPIRDVIEDISDEERTQLKKSISYSIVLDIYSILHGPERDSQRAWAAEDFWLSCQAEKPSELATRAKESCDHKLVYYLRNICTESIMQYSVAFPTSVDLAEERLNICRTLLQLDPSNSSVYHNEIKDILRRLTIRRRMREIEQSRIYVDITSIKQIARKTLLESYNRYRSFREQGIGHISEEAAKDVSAVVASLMNTGDKDRLAALVALHLPHNELDEILESLVVRLRDEYVFSTEHGLNRYLSTRIRHGTLSSELRRPLENVQLITPRDRSTGKHLDNVHWLTKVSNLEQQSKDRLSEALGEFSGDFERLVSEINSDWLQVKREPHAKGMFDFTLLRKGVQIMAHQIPTDMDFEGFLDVVMEQFGIILDMCLDNVRARMQDEAKIRISRNLTALQSKVEQLGDSSDIRELANAIRTARTAMQVQLDRVMEWFRRARTVANEPYLIEDAISIALGSVSIGQRNLVPTIKICPQLRIRQLGDGLNFLVDILFNVFQNIVRHADIPRVPDTVVEVLCVDACGPIKIRIENEISESVRTADAERHLEEIRHSMGQVQMKSVSAEGGTGFYKIIKILQHDFHIESPSLEFGYKGNNGFFVEFELPSDLLCDDAEGERLLGIRNGE